MKPNGSSKQNGKRTNGKTGGAGANHAGVDWEIAHQRILEGTARLAWMEEELPQDQLEQAWARRAGQIAQVIDEENQGEQIELALVRLGREIYGLDVQYVYEIRVLDHITRVPRVPEWVAGVVNLRGRILSALDLKRFLGIAASESRAVEPGAAAHLAVIEVPEMELALMVDEVLAIETFPVRRIQDPGTAVRGIRAEYVRGILMRGEANMIIILDLPALLADKRLIIHEEIL